MAVAETGTGLRREVTSLLQALLRANTVNPPGNEIRAAEVLRDYFAKLNVPVLANFPVGHVRFNATLPVGAMAELDADAQTLRLLENPVTP